jgi:dienelactone hydrolase
MIGAYGQWAAGLAAGELPGLSLRRGEYHDVAAWRRAARQRLLERMAPPKVACPEEIETVEVATWDGLDVERLRWQLPYGPPTEAVLIKPAGHAGALPGVLALHCHSGKKYWGRRKIARWGEPHPLMRQLQDHQYGGRAWANELARRGYVVLVHDAFAFGSRRVRAADCTEPVRGSVVDPTDDDHEGIAAYDEWAAAHENIMAKCLFCAGTTWPGVFWAEDRAALDVLAARDDVDDTRLGCGGLSGGGLRTCFLAGLDDRIAAAVCAGFMTTWVDFLLRKVHTHTWMTYVPLLPNELDFPEILGLRAPAPALVLSTTEDPLFTPEAVTKSEKILTEIYRKAGGEDRLRFSRYPGHHKLDVPMQEEAFDFFDRCLKG